MRTAAARTPLGSSELAVDRSTLRLLAGMRIALNTTVDDTVRALVVAWARAWDELAPAWDTALTDLITATADGGWPTRAQILRAERALRALDLTRDALEQVVSQAGGTILQALPDLTADAAAWQARLTASQLPPTAGTQAVLNVAFNRVDPAALEWIVGRTTGQITSLMAPLSGQAYAAMQATLIRGVTLGDNPRGAAREMVRRVGGDFNGGLTRAATIARTEMLDAHRAASQAQDLANTDVLRGWAWMCTLDTRTCPSCLAMHGTEHALTEGGPSDHQNGRCARIPLTKTWADLGFTGVEEPASVVPDARAWFDALPETDQVSIMGPERLNLLRTGQATWDDLSLVRTTPGWRDSHTVTPVRLLRGRTAA